MVQQLLRMHKIGWPQVAISRIVVTVGSAVYSRSLCPVLAWLPDLVNSRVCRAVRIQRFHRYAFVTFAVAVKRDSYKVKSLSEIS